MTIIINNIIKNFNFNLPSLIEENKLAYCFISVTSQNNKLIFYVFNVLESGGSFQS